MATANALIARLETAAPDYRVAPNNIDAEQALLGAILVNNDAYYRVSDFLEPGHFFEDLHKRIYEIATTLIKSGKVATPITLKTFLGDQDLGGVTVSQYLARLAAEATTVINAEDYGRTVYDLAIRRSLISIGEGMVNVAYDAPVESSPRSQIEETERKLYELAETGKYDGGFQRFSEALTTAIDMAANAFKREGKLSGTATGLADLDRMMGGLQPSDMIIIAGRPGMGKTALATNIAFNVAKDYALRETAGRQPQDRQRRRRRLLLARDVGRAARDPHHRRAVRHSLLQDPPRRHPRGRFLQAHRRRPRPAGDAALHRPDRRPRHCAARGAGAAPEAPARPRPPRRRLPAAALGIGEEGREPGPGADRDHHRHEGAGKGAERPDPRPVAALASGRAARRQAPAAFRSARIRARSSRTPTS